MAEISRRAGVGMATLYRNFPGRRELLEALYSEEVDAICKAAETPDGQTPGARLVSWLRQLFAFFASKRHIASELLKHTDSSDPVFGGGRARVIAAGQPLLTAAQQACEVVANLAGLLRGSEQRLAGGEDTGATAAEHGVAVVGVLEQLGGDVTLACEEGEELAQPGDEARAGRLPVWSIGGLADGVDLLGVQGLEKLTPTREVAVEGRHADTGASRDLGHRHLSIGIRERGARDRDDLVAVALGVGSPNR